MAKPKSTIWQLDEHSFIKHQILEEYLKAWFPILTSWQGRVVFVDGFAGPGIYLKGERGSPLIAIDTFLEHFRTDKMEAVFRFFEEDKARAEHLQKILDNKQIPPRATYSVTNNTFLNSADELLSYGENRNLKLRASLWFIDPFGFGGVPMSLLARISKQPASEVILNFMSTDVNRFLFASNRRPDECYEALFGLDARQFLSENRTLREVVDFYLCCLKRFTSFRYTLDFAVGNKQSKGQSWYHLIFATSSERGIEKMKDAMWKAAPLGNYTYNARMHYEGQLLLLSEDNLAPLRDALKQKFSGSVVTIEQIEKFVLLETIYRKAHVRMKTLKPMEKDGEITVETQRKKNLTYPAGTKIRFS